MYSPGAPPLPPGRPPELAQQVVPADFAVSQPLWRSGAQLRQHLRELVEHAALLKAVATELEVFESLGSKPNSASASIEPVATTLAGAAADDFKDVHATEASSIVPFQVASDGSATLNEHPVSSLVSVSGSESVAVRAELLAAVQISGRAKAHAVEAALELQNRVTNLLAPLEGALGAPGGWEHAAAAARLRTKREKIQRNRKWRKRKRQRIAEARRKEQEEFEEADRKVDEWRAREIAKSIARSKMEKMKVVAEKKAKEDRARLEAELEMVLMVEKLQELRALRIQKLKKQGRFFPDEDDKFMERVRAAVEEEERQAAAAADTRAAAAAIASATEAAKITGQVSTAPKADGNTPVEDKPQKIDEEVSDAVLTSSADQNVVEAPISSSSAPSAEEERGTTVQEAYKLPAEFYHFYYGSQVDLGTLIEVRRAWDAYLMPGGRKIPGHWIEAPPPADAIWASYLVRPTSKTDISEVIESAGGFSQFPCYYVLVSIMVSSSCECRRQSCSNTNAASWSRSTDEERIILPKYEYNPGTEVESSQYKPCKRHGLAKIVQNWYSHVRLIGTLPSNWVYKLSCFGSFFSRCGDLFLCFWTCGVGKHTLLS